MKMNRRKALIGIGSLAVGSGAALGSGAFTSVEADRTVSISTSDDSAALLRISDASNGQFTSTTAGTNAASEIQIDIPDLNDDAQTEIEPLLTVGNDNGIGEAVGVQFDLSDDGSGDPVGDYLSFDVPDGSGGTTDITNNWVTLTSGDSIDVNVKIDTTFSLGDNIQATIKADTSQS